MTSEGEVWLEIARSLDEANQQLIESYPLPEDGETEEFFRETRERDILHRQLAYFRYEDPKVSPFAALQNARASIDPRWRGLDSELLQAEFDRQLAWFLQRRPQSPLKAIGLFLSGRYNDEVWGEAGVHY